MSAGASSSVGVAEEWSGDQGAWSAAGSLLASALPEAALSVALLRDRIALRSSEIELRIIVLRATMRSRCFFQAGMCRH